jgi:hypothetical protein
MAFASLADVDAWIAEEGNSLERLWELTQSGQFSGENARWGNLWLRRHAVKQDEKHSLEVLELHRRTTTATEIAAKAARASAATAAIAVGVSLVSLGIAVVALSKP